ncbi:DUF4747 family protein [Shewanella dokdonensis]|uniref:DUF4747 family protein n=1 Tax=Shewanella dokdonensis TaxID=712036 RepID=A0ABX8DF15_9GAMM|nr:DUF4747 family protein [Shewanella dokdonensis]MCL1076500.1 DUF4747 family protein [Shewanella dokdonensis]QVK23280.1 DUF4747 family protein [Shewanella dokdonensis]
MPDKKVEVGAINITIQPHTPEKYIQLFKEAVRLKRPIKLRGDRHALLANMYKIRDDQEDNGPITGDIYCFTSIDVDGDWFNTDTGKLAEDELLEGIDIPENLKPNGARFTYIFYPQEHLLFYEAYYNQKSLGAVTAQKFLHTLFNQKSLQDKYGVVDVTHIPEKEQLEKALMIPFKEMVEMTFTRPNPDNLEEAEANFLNRMDKLNVAKLEQSYKAVKGMAIEMDPDMIQDAKISARNGTLMIKGKDEASKPVKFSTVDHPLRHIEYYDPKQQITFDVLVGISQRLKDVIKRWLE